MNCLLFPCALGTPEGETSPSRGRIDRLKRSSLQKRNVIPMSIARAGARERFGDEMLIATHGRGPIW